MELYGIKYKVDNRPKKGWWAPGDYIHRCRICNDRFIGDKRAGHCADCEYSKDVPAKNNDFKNE